jgi:hypothetical protein
VKVERRRGKPDGRCVARCPAKPAGPIADEQKAAMLFALGKADEALPLRARSLIQTAGGRIRSCGWPIADSLSA